MQTREWESNIFIACHLKVTEHNPKHTTKLSNEVKFQLSVINCYIAWEHSSKLFLAHFQTSTIKHSFGMRGCYDNEELYTAIAHAHFNEWNRQQNEKKSNNGGYKACLVKYLRRKWWSTQMDMTELNEIFKGKCSHHNCDLKVQQGETTLHLAVVRVALFNTTSNNIRGDTDKMKNVLWMKLDNYRTTFCESLEFHLCSAIIRQFYLSMRNIVSFPSLENFHPLYATLWNAPFNYEKKLHAVSRLRSPTITQ